MARPSPTATCSRSAGKVNCRSCSTTGALLLRTSHELALHLQLHLRDIGAEEERDRPVENDAKATVPARHLKEVVGPPDPPGRKAGEAHAEHEGHRARVAQRSHRSQWPEDERRRLAALDRRSHIES